MKESTCRKIIRIVFVCVFICMLVLNFLTPMISDDFAHYYGKNGKHISSFPEIAENLIVLRNETNGRVISHFFVYLFQIPPKAVFNIVNAAVSMFVLLLLFRYFKVGNAKRSLVLLMTAVFMLWYFMPGFGQIFLWLTGSCNYSWGLALDLALIYPFFKEYTTDESEENRKDRKFGILKKIMLIILAFIAGAYSENGATALIFTMGIFTLLIWIRNKKLPVIYLILDIGACLGFMFLMLAPSEIGGRTGDLSFGGISDSIKNCLMLTRKYCLVLFAIYFAFLGLAIFHRKNKRIIISSAVLTAAGIVSIAVFALAAYLPQRSFFIMVTFMTLACILLLREIWESDSRKLAVMYVSVMAVIFAFSFTLGAGDILSLKMQEKNRIEQINQAIAEEKYDITLKAYASSTMYPAAFAEELAEESSAWYNELLAKYYGLSSVSGTEINYYFD